MMRTLSYRFEGTRWVAVAELVPCDRCGGHWHPIGPLEHTNIAASGREHTFWRGDDLAARSINEP